MGGKDKRCKIIAEKENIWLGKVTQSLNPAQALTRESLGVLRKIRDLSLFLWEMGRGLEDKGRRGPLFSFSMRLPSQIVLYNNKAIGNHWAISGFYIVIHVTDNILSHSIHHLNISFRENI